MMGKSFTEVVRSALGGGGPTLEYKERGGRRRNGNLVAVNGCSKSAQFKTYYGNPGGRRGRGPACDKALAMNRHYVEFANKHLQACAQQSADRAFGHGQILTNGGDNAVYHHGCVGDSRHQKTGSWHNEGLAWDVTAIKIGGKVLKYSDARRDRKVGSFYQHLRKCWGEKVAANGKSCRQSGKKKGIPAGTIGYEDRRHRHHLHLSLPCKALSNGRATFTASHPFFEQLFPVAHVEESEDEMDGVLSCSVPTVKTESVS